MKKSDLIKLACHKILAVPDFIAKDNTTYCNIGTYFVLRELNLNNKFFNINKKRIMLANEMYDVLDKEYKRINITDLINRDFEKVYVACVKDEPHGHIAIIYPDKTLCQSGKWKLSVPLCCNFGKENGIMGLNYAFRYIPDIFELGDIQ